MELMDVMDVLKRLLMKFLLISAKRYVKEFVHGDLGRTEPSLCNILDKECDILELDVEVKENHAISDRLESLCSYHFWLRLCYCYRIAQRHTKFSLCLSFDIGMAAFSKPEPKPI
jgi:hypothetical protein